MIELSAKSDSTQRSKAARMDEWSRLPLRGWSDMDRWLTAMSDRYEMPQNQHMAVEETCVTASPSTTFPTQHETQPHNSIAGIRAEGSSAVSEWHPRSNRGHASSSLRTCQPLAKSSSHSRDEASNRFEVIAPPTHTLPEHARLDLASHSSQRTISDDNQSSRAEELVTSKPNTYF